MQTIAVFVACLAVASAASSYTVRVPSHDSAVIESHRLGGNFAYSTSEGHAHAVVSPVVQNVATPVAYSSLYNINGLPVNSQLNNVAVVRSGSLINGAQISNLNGVQLSNLNNLNGVQLSNLNGVQYSNLNGVQLASNINGVQLSNLNQLNNLNNVAVVRSGSLINGVSNLNTINGLQLSNLNNINGVQLSNLNNLNVLPISSVVV